MTDTVIALIVRAGVLALAVLASLVMNARAEAQEYCVVCAEPQAMYRCAMDNFTPGTQINLPAVCQEQMAKLGPHASCRIGKGITVLDCKGPLMRLDMTKPSAPRVFDSAAKDKADAEKAASKGEPKTVEEMIKRAQKSLTPSDAPAPAKAAAPAAGAPAAAPSGKTSGPSSATSAPAKAAAQKSNPLADTWRCLSTFFTKCGEK